MDKLRLIRIYELRGKVHPIEATIIDLLDIIEEEHHRDWIVYKKNGISYFAYYLINNDIVLSYPLENEFKDNFGCNIEEIREIMKYLLEKHLKLKINNVK